jgi:hypothetical protein
LRRGHIDASFRHVVEGLAEAGGVGGHSITTVAQ